MTSALLANTAFCALPVLRRKEQAKSDFRKEKHRFVLLQLWSEKLDSSKLALQAVMLHFLCIDHMALSTAHCQDYNSPCFCVSCFHWDSLTLAYFCN